jgi:hypothetical protein
MKITLRAVFIILIILVIIFLAVVGRISENENIIKEHAEIEEKKYELRVEEISEEYKEKYLEGLLQYLTKWNENLKSNKSVLQTYIYLLNDTHKLLVEEQWVAPLKVTKRLIPLSFTLNCTNEINSKYFNERKENNILPYLIDIFIFGFELKLIEIQLYELYEVVDEFVIFESNITLKKIPKELFFTQNLKRFHRFIDKITLMTPFSIKRFNKDGSIKSSIDIDLKDVRDDFKYKNQVDVSKIFRPDFALEFAVRMIPVDYYQKYIRMFNSNDILIHGDVDEIPDSNIVNHFKYCETKNELFPFSIWSNFYIYNLNYLFRSDDSRDSYGFMCPYIFKFKDILNNNNYTRLRKTTLLPQASGSHLNRVLGPIVNGMYKDMSQSDSDGLTQYYLDVIKNPTIEGYNRFKELYIAGRINEKWINRVVKVSSFNSKLKTFIPWIIKENREVYKTFFE